MSDLPPGFVLDGQSGGLPPGFVLDTPVKGNPIGAAMSVNNPPPAMGPPAPPETAPSRPWGDVLGSAATNFLPSVGKAAEGFYDAVTDPIGTGKNLVKLGVGALENLPQPYQTQERKNALAATEKPETTAARESAKATASAVGNEYANRYGGLENIKNTIANDPAGVLLDASMVLPAAGATLPAKVGGVVGKVGAAIDPLTAAGNALKGGAKVGEVVGANALGMSTGAGPEAVRIAGRAGREGGDAAKAFADNMRDNVPIENIVAQAKSAVGEMRQERAAAYKSGMADVSKDKTVLDFGPIEDSVGKANEVGSFKGITVNRSAGDTNTKIAGIVNEWKALDPAEYHTPEGLDALKRTIGDLRDSTDYGTPARVAADRVYNAIKAEIQAQAPGYAQVMGGYSKASEGLNEVTKTLSLGEKASKDTAARKLTSVMRNNAQTNYGAREKLVNQLAEYEPTLPYSIAGQSLNALAPRGLVGRGGMAAMAGTAFSNPAHLALLPGFSPRIVGEVVYLGGKAIGKVDDVAEMLHITPQNLRLLDQAGFQGGRNNALAQ